MKASLLFVKTKLFVQVLGKETEESAAFELDLTSLRQVLALEETHWHLNLLREVGFGDPL